LADRRRVTNGARARLSAEQQAPLFEALQGRSDDGGLWTGPKAAAYGARSRQGPASGPVACPSGRQTARTSLSSPASLPTKFGLGLIECGRPIFDNGQAIEFAIPG
jgi:hypothetical protein